MAVINIIMKNIKSSYEDLQSNIRTLQTPDIEVWANQYADKNYSVHLETSEFTCICPKTSLPDFADIKLDYGPDQSCLELKSFKMYLLAYRDVGIFHEHLVNKVLEDIVKACSPRWAKLEIVMNPRGGITTTVKAEYKEYKR